MAASWLEKLRKHKNWQTLSALAIIILAGALVEIMSLAQYRYARNMVEEEIDYRAERELTITSYRVKGMLNSCEQLMRNYQWIVQQRLDQPDSIYSILRHIVSTNNDVRNSFIAFVPEFTDGELFEPVAYNSGDKIVTAQVANASHDYTQYDFYRYAVEKDSAFWSDPYTDAFGQQVTSYSMPITDPKTGKIVGVFGLDLSTQCIIDTINARHKQESAYFLLLTEDGDLIAHPDSTHSKWHDMKNVVHMVNDSSVERHHSASCTSKIIQFNDSKDNSIGYIYHGHLKGQPHWQIGMVCYDDEVYGKLHRMRHIFMLMMLGGFSLMGFILYRYNRNLKRLHASKLSKERTDSELRIAQNIQSEMLPSHGIHRPDVDISGKQITALEVGGDLYDYFVRDEKLYFCIGDVSGKGVPSSLVMAVVHSHFRSFAQHESNPARIMHAINEAACEGNDTNMFVTLFIGVLDLPTGRLRYCNAGHDAPLLINDEVKPLDVTANMPVGVFNDFKYVQQKEQLANGTTLFLYTDGLTEANNPSSKLFGMQRVINAAEKCRDKGRIAPAEIMDAMHDAVVQFAAGAEQSDDLTMLVLQYHQPEEKVLLDETITLPNDVLQVPRLNEFVKSVAERLNLDTSIASQLMLAVEEAVVNAMNYAYPMGTEGTIDVTAHSNENSLKFIISDEGKAFDPTQTSQADTSLNAEERPIGGLGILLVQQLMDSINYERINGKNVLTLKKNFNNQQ